MAGLYTRARATVASAGTWRKPATTVCLQKLLPAGESEIPLQNHLTDPPPPPMTSMLSECLEQEEVLMFDVSLADHEYRRRAWVTQEIMLAKAI